MEVLTPRPTGEGQTILFVTFYSFKGGVGRTLALLNVACILAGLGRRVLMIDFDLEAPGLTHFQDKQIEAGFSRQQPGLVDAIDDFLKTPKSSPLGEEETSLFFERYVSSLDVPEGVQKGEKDGTLDLVPAGRLDEDYEGRMYDLNFEEMFEEGVGRPLFERMKDLIKDSGRYDYILIDSRTGFSDEGSICTRFLGEYLLVLTGLNHQNVRGTARFLQQANVTERDETLALVASPVPMYYEDLRAKRIDAAKEHISERAGLDDIRFVSQIPYHPVLALEEDPTVRSLEGTDLFESYEEITERLRTWAGDRPEERIERVLNLLKEGDAQDALAVFRDVRHEDPEVALQFLRGTGQILGQDYPEVAAELLGEGIALAQENENLKAKGDLLTLLAEFYTKRGEVEKAVRKHKEALGISQDLNDANAIATDLFNLGNLYREQGNNSKAIEYYEKAKSFFRESGNQSGEARTLVNLGNRYSEQDEVESSIDCFERAYDLSRKAGDQHSEAGALANLASRYAKRGDTERAIEYYEKSQELFDREEDYYRQAKILENLGDVYFSSRKFERSIERYEQGLSLQSKLDNRSDEARIIRSLAGKYIDLGEVDRAIELLEKGCKMSRKAEDRPNEAQFLHGLGYCYLEKGDLIESKEYFTDALEISRKNEERAVEGLVLLNISLLHSQSNNKKEALGKLDQARKTINSLGQPPLDAALHFYQARVLYHLKPDQALYILSEKWDLIQDHSNPIDKMEPHVLRARLRLEVENDVDGAAEDAQAALDFYREHDVDSRWSREAEEILEKTQTPDAS